MPALYHYKLQADQKHLTSLVRYDTMSETNLPKVLVLWLGAENVAT